MNLTGLAQSLKLPENAHTAYDYRRTTHGSSHTGFHRITAGSASRSSDAVERLQDKKLSTRLWLPGWISGQAL